MSDVLVLCYHAVSDDWPADLSVTPSQLERQLGTLVARGYQGATFTEVVKHRPTRPTVVATFDDAYRSVLTRALPVLDALGIPGTVYAPTDFVGSTEPMVWPGIDRWIGTAHEQELLPLDWDELGELAHAGWEVGSHSCTHPRLTQLDDDALREELVRSRERCETQLGSRCTSLAYPYGDADARVVEAARTSGYAAGCLLPARFARPQPRAWPRVGVYHHDSHNVFRAKVSRSVRAVRGTPVWDLIDRARSRAPSIRPGSGDASPA